MLPKPDICCPCGSYEHQIPVNVRGAVVWVDICIAQIVVGLNAASVRTVASCCGHGIMPGRISLCDGRELIVLDGWPDEAEECVKALQREDGGEDERA